PVIRIKSKRSLGRVGDEITDILCRVTGYERSFPFIDKQTGEQSRGFNVDMLLELVE
ncbi:DNA-binding protein G5P, partial [Escherichia coli]|nr:DNA-binding protein G5P [Escherichia coli]